MPVRRCISCRRSTDKKSLARFVFCDGSLVWDEAQKLVGRGAYVHKDISCLNRSRNVGVWQRALRLKTGELVRIDPASFEKVYTEITYGEN